MAWYNEIGAESDVVVSSRIRFARNIAGYPFGKKLNDAGRSEIIDKVTKALAPAGLETIDLAAKNNIDTSVLAEKRYISSEFASEKAPHTLLLDESKQTAVMICGEDHVRITAFSAGLSLKEAYDKAVALDDLLDAGVDIAYSESVGYLSQNPTDLGTGMRASLLLHLPATALARQIGAAERGLAKLGVTMRAYFGESGEAYGSLYQISNSVTMGISEEEIIEKLVNVAKQLIESERKLRDTLKSDSFARLCDRVMRAKGLLCNAYLMSASEFMGLWSDVRLGVSLGIVEGCDLAALDSLLVGAMPANLIAASSSKADITAAELETMRAKTVRETLAK